MKKTQVSDWSEIKDLVLRKMDKDDERFTRIEQKIDNVVDSLNNFKVTITPEVAVNKVKIGAWSGIVAAATAALTTIGAIFVKSHF